MNVAIVATVVNVAIVATVVNVNSSSNRTSPARSTAVRHLQFTSSVWISRTSFSSQSAKSIIRWARNTTLSIKSRSCHRGIAIRLSWNTRTMTRLNPTLCWSRFVKFPTFPWTWQRSFFQCCPESESSGILVRYKLQGLNYWIWKWIDLIRRRTSGPMEGQWKLKIKIIQGRRKWWGHLFASVVPINGSSNEHRSMESRVQQTLTAWEFSSRSFVVLSS